MSKEILFTFAQDPSYTTTNLAEKLDGIRKKGFEQYYDTKFLNDFIEARRKQDGDNFSFSWNSRNPAGEWMSKNVKAASKVVDEPINVERIQAELEKDRFGYIVVATHLSGYSDFRNVAKYIHKAHPNVKVIASSAGSFVDETAQLADFTLRGDQVHDLREIIGETTNDPLKIVTVRSDTKTQFHGVTKKGSYALLVSSLGCMYGCDYCVSTAQFGTDFKNPFSAQQIKDAIISAHDTIAPDSKIFTVSLAEPQGLGNVRLWKEVFKLCRDMPFQCELVSTTSSKVMERYDLDELTLGALRLGTVNIGVESLLQGYKKNEAVDLMALNTRLREAGVNVVSTFIIGFDWHTKANIGNEIRLLKDLGSSGYIAANLEMKPGTPLYKAFKNSGRLLDVPPELLSFYGYQAYKHPEFATGFNDILPLLEEVGTELSAGNQALSPYLSVFLKRRNAGEAQQRRVIQGMIDDFASGIDPAAYEGDITKIVDQFSADLYYNLAFRHMDLFHPFVII